MGWMSELSWGGSYRMGPRERAASGDRLASLMLLITSRARFRPTS